MAPTKLGQRRKTKRAVIIKPKKRVGPEDFLTPKEEEMVRKGEQQLRQRQYITLDELERELDRQARKRSRKTA